MNAPDASIVLRAIADLISAEHPPAAAGQSVDYGKQQLTRSPMMMLAIAQEFDRAAHWRVQENCAIRQLFAQAVEQIDDPSLKQRLAAESARIDQDFRVSVLEETNRRLRALLVELHAQVQQANDAASEKLNEAIWLELRASTERRRSLLDRF